MPAVMWFRRDLRLRGQPGPGRGVRRRRRAPAVRARPRAVGPGRPGRAAPTSPPRCAPSTPRSGSGGRGCRSSAATRYAGWCWPRARSAPSGCTSRPTSAPTAARRDDAVEQALAEHGIELVRTGSPYAVAPGRVTSGAGEPYRVFTPFSKAWADHGWRGPVDAPTGAELARARRHHRPPRARAPRRDRACPRPARPRPHAGGATSSTTGSPTTTPTATGPASTAPRTCRCTSSGARSTRARCSPTWPGCAAPAPRRTARSSPGASSTPTCCCHRPETAREYLRPEFARMAYDEPGERSSTPGAAAAPASRSSTPGCASCARPAGCTTGCG